MSLAVGIPKELKRGERRVSLTPKGVRFLREHGIAVYVEENAGLLSGFSNEEYERAGGILIRDPKTLWSKAQLIKKVKEPIESEFQFFSPEHILFAFLHLASPAQKPLISALQKAKTTAIAYETIEKNGETPLLTPMSQVAGILVAYYGAIFKKHITVSGNKMIGIGKVKVLMEEFAASYTLLSFPHAVSGNPKNGSPTLSEKNVKFFPKSAPRMSASVKTRAALPQCCSAAFGDDIKFLILGGGHVGKAAAQMAMKMGAEVWISEISEARRKTLQASYRRTPYRVPLSRTPAINVIDPSNLKQYYECLHSADVIIGAVHTAGRRAPLIIDRELLRKISSKKPKIILDVSIDQGGNIAESKPMDYENPLELDSFGNLRFSVTNIPSFCGRGASVALEAASLTYTSQLAQGLERAIQISPELKTGINILKGEIVHPAIKALDVDRGQ